MKALLLLLLCVVRAHVLCRQLGARHIGAGQPFQLPIHDDDDDDYYAVYALVQRMQAEPWNLTGTRVIDGWLDVGPPQPYSQQQLMRLFGCR